jgi:NADH-quinone oxidoreductase subunit G
MPTVYIDNKAYEVKEGKNLLEAALGLGFDLPYFCWHPALGSVGACRQCAVKIFKDEKDTAGKIVMSCMEGVREGVRFSINDATANAFREQVIEWLMTNHPHDCPVCDEGGNCHLQDMTVMTGHDYRRHNYKKRTYPNQYLGPFIHHEMNRCIQCYRCVRFYHDYAGGEDLNVFAAHNHVFFGREKDGVLQSPFSGNLAEVCPTGVFTDKTLKEHYTRKWDLTSAPSVCHHCSLGCNTTASERYGELRCISNRFNGEVNGYFLCDRGRFGYEFVNSDNRITQPIIRNRVSQSVDEANLMNHLRLMLSTTTLIGIGSPRATVEANFSLMQLVGKENFYQGIMDDQAFLEKKIANTLQSGTVRTASLKDIEQADAVLVLGEDIWNTAPVMALAVRQSVMKTAANDAVKQTPLPGWHDAAIKELVQEQKGFLANITLVPSPLNGIASFTYHAAPNDMARLGFAIAHHLDSSLPSVPNNNGSLDAKAKSIAEALQKAKRPVIISGTSSYNEPLIRAAHNITAVLNKPDRNASISYVLRECNSMGAALMQAPSFEKAVSRIPREKDVTVIILENDLYKNIPATAVDAFLNQCKNIVVLDSLNNHTTQKAHVLIPSSTFAEGDGTLVNNEGRAQRFFQVFFPKNSLIQESWRWIVKMKALQSDGSNGLQDNPDVLLSKVETSMPQFAGISSVAPPYNFRINGQPIPRESHRYSGRTAILANINVSEPKPPHDNDSPLTFTMEGYTGIPPAPLIPFFWSPGWNSIQSVNKYQNEVGGSLIGGDPGVRLFQEKKESIPSFSKEIAEPFTVRQKKWFLLPEFHVFGSEELSMYSPGIKELSPDPYIKLSKEDAKELGVVENSMLSIKDDGRSFNLPVVIQNELTKGIVLVPEGITELGALNWGHWISLEKAQE